MLGIERILHFEGIENETLLKRYFGWTTLPDYTTYYNDLQRFEKVEDVEGLKETNQRLTERVLSKQDRLFLDFDSSVNIKRIRIRSGFRRCLLRKFRIFMAENDRLQHPYFIL